MTEFESVFPYTQAHSCRIAVSAGVHPIESTESSFFSDIISFCEHGDIIAVGECGFDFSHDPMRTMLRYQSILFQRHIQLALDFNLPLIVHSVKATDVIFSFVPKLSSCRCVFFHGWGGTASEAEYLLDHGVNAIFGFGNRIVKNNSRALSCLSYLPLDRIVVETDAPFQLIDTFPMQWANTIFDIYTRIATEKSVTTASFVNNQKTIWQKYIKAEI